MEPTKTEGSGWALGLIAGGLIGFFLAAGLGGIGAFYYGKREHKRVRAGWNLVPVVVANEDIAAGAEITFDAISQRPIPEQFVTSSVVRPDSASYIVGVRVITPLQAGDPVRWSDLASALDRDECARVCTWVAEARKRVAPAKQPDP
jgi:Flp pilus assembly protein CpaB